MVIDIETRLDFAKGISPRKLTSSIGRSGLKLAEITGPTGIKVGEGILGSPKIGKIEPVRADDNSAFVARLPRVMERLLLVDQVGRQLNDAAYTDYIGRDSLETDFLPIAAALARTDLSPQAVIRVVHGASTDVPYRGISYHLPALVLAEQLINEGVDVQIQVIYANHISGSLNDKDLEKARTEGMLLARAQKGFAERFFPESVVDSMVFLEDRDLATVPYFETEIRRLALIMGDVLPDDLRAQFRAKDGKHGGNGNHLDYTGAHLLVHNRGSIELFQPLFEGQAEAIDTKIILNYGGGSEGPFFHARTLAAAFAGPEYQILNMQYFSRHRFPGYFTGEGGDISLRTVLSSGEVPAFDRKNPNFSRGAGADINYLIKFSQYKTGGDESLRDFLTTFRRQVYEE